MLLLKKLYAIAELGVLLIVLGVMTALLKIKLTFRCSTFESVLFLIAVLLCAGYGIYKTIMVLI